MILFAQHGGELSGLGMTEKVTTQLSFAIINLIHVDTVLMQDLSLDFKSCIISFRSPLCNEP